MKKITYRTHVVTQGLSGPHNPF